MTKTYLLFGFDTYYPIGGMADLVKCIFEKDDRLAKREAKKVIKNRKYKNDHYELYLMEQGSQPREIYIGEGE